LRVCAPKTALLGQAVARELVAVPPDLGTVRIDVQDQAPDWDPMGRLSQAELWHGDTPISRLLGIYSTEQIAQFLHAALARTEPTSYGTRLTHPAADQGAGRPVWR
ncbi:MAG: hypothetical protein FJ029_13350, partial [Actinobacteria bacterium]|nr:hypothetical protein [Actinomycetota bacterium]